MDFRWKNRGGDLPQVQPNFVDPQGVRVTMAQQQMAGYRPNPQTNMQGYSGAPTRAPMVGNPGSGEGYQFDASGIDAFNEKKRKLEQLKAQLAEVDAQIAEVQRQDVEQDVAAKLASIGELGLYQQLLSQRQNAETTKRSAAQGVENALYQAEGLVGGLKSVASEDREQFLAKIKALQNQARDRAKASGMSDADFENLPVNQRVSEAINRYEGGTAADETYLAFETDIMKKVQDKALHDADLANLRAKANEYGNNSKVGRQLLDLIDKYKGVTVESRGKTAANKALAEQMSAELSSMKLKSERDAYLENLDANSRKILKAYFPKWFTIKE